MLPMAFFSEAAEPRFATGSAAPTEYLNPIRRSVGPSPRVGVPLTLTGQTQPVPGGIITTSSPAPPVRAIPQLPGGSGLDSSNGFAVDGQSAAESPGTGGGTTVTVDGSPQTTAQPDWLMWLVLAGIAILLIRRK